MKRRFVLMMLITVVALGGLYAGGTKESSSMEDTSMEGEAMEDESMEGEDSMAQDDDAMMMSATASRMEFTTLEDAQMYAESGPTVLFFVDDSEASEMVEMTINEHFAELPPHVTLITVPVTNSRLTERYDVSSPGTFVLIDDDAMVRSQWTGGDIETFTMMIEDADEAM